MNPHEKRRRELQKQLNVLAQRHQNFSNDTDFDADFRAAECKKAEEEIKQVNDELKRLKSQGELRVLGVVVVVILWIAAMVAGGYFLGGAIFAALFWGGIGVGLIVGFAVWVRNKLS